MSFSKKNVNLFIGTGVLYSLILLCWLVFSKFPSTDTFSVHYSLLHFLIILVISFILLLFFGAWLVNRKWSFFESEKFRTFFFSNFLFWTFLGFCTLSIFLFVLTVFHLWGNRNIYFERGFPLILEIFFFSTQYLIGYIECGGKNITSLIAHLQSFAKDPAKKMRVLLACRNLLIFVCVWAILVLIYHRFFPVGQFETPKWFPLSVFYITGFHQSGIIYMILFWVLFLVIALNYKKIHESLILVLCWFIVILGNLMQGGFVSAFLESFYATEVQYYSDAIKITDWQSWLATFNQNQPNLQIHAQTHPPFAVLIHNLFLHIHGDSLIFLGIGFAFLSLCTIPLFLLSLRAFDTETQKRKALLLLFALVPAVNIYSIVSLDGIIMTTCTIFLLGVVILLRKPQKMAMGISLITLGFLFTNMLTYGGVLLLAIGGLVALFELFKYHKVKLLIGMVICVIVSICVALWLKFAFNYDHLLGFITSSHLENPDGFRLIHNTVNYLLTRVEDFSEIAFFLSFGVLAMMALGHPGRFSWKEFFNKDSAVVALAGVVALTLAFLSGAFRTGETARACLFIYPYIFLFLVDRETLDFNWMLVLAAVQTSIMQSFFSFYW